MDADIHASYAQVIGEALAETRVESVVFEGEGDFCRAYAVNGSWIFRFAYNDEGSRSLEREAALMPALAPTLPLPVPNISLYGRQRENGLAFVAYFKIMGTELTRARLQGLPREGQEACALELGNFLRALHGFDVDLATKLGVPTADYPFSRTEAGIMRGSAAEIYRREAARLMGYHQVDHETRRDCEGIVEELLAGPRDAELAPAPVHGDLSADHVLFDVAQGRITGVIDFSDAIITTPLLDFVYLYRSYGEAFVGRVAKAYGRGDNIRFMEEVRLLHSWYLAMRLLWALDHDYEPGIERGLRELREAGHSE